MIILSRNGTRDNLPLANYMVKLKFAYDKSKRQATTRHKLLLDESALVARGLEQFRNHPQDDVAPAGGEAFERHPVPRLLRRREEVTHL